MQLTQATQVGTQPGNQPSAPPAAASPVLPVQTLPGTLLPGTPLPATRPQLPGTPLPGTTLPGTPLPGTPLPSTPRPAPDQTSIEIDLPVTLEGRVIGAARARVTATALVSVRPDRLATLLQRRITDEAMASLVELGNAEADPQTLATANIYITFNSAALTLNVRAPMAQAGPFNLSLMPEASDSGLITVDPARLAAGITGSLQIGRNFSQDLDTRVTGSFSGFLNIGGLRGLNVDYGGSVNLSSDFIGDRFTRDRIVAFVDRPNAGIRYLAGDLSTTLSTLGGISNFQGLAVTRSWRDLQPNRNIRPVGRRSFVLDRAADVIVLVNGQQVARFRAPPGEVNLSDIPLVDTSNDIQVIVEDEFGRRTTQSFSVASDIDLLEPGLNEYFIGIGRARSKDRFGFSYDSDIVLSAVSRWGISNALTLGAFTELAQKQQIVGGEATFVNFGGVGRAELIASNSDEFSQGFAGGVDYIWDNVSATNRLGRSVQFSVDYQTRDFLPAGSLAPTGLEWSAQGTYLQDLSTNLRLFASAGWTRRYQDKSNTEFYSVGLSRIIGRLLLSATLRHSRASSRESQTGVGFTLTRRFGTQSSGSLSYDTASDTAVAEFRRFGENRLGARSYAVSVERTKEATRATAEAGYTGNRFLARVDLRQQSSGGAFDGDLDGTLRLQSGIAFADGAFGIGRDPGRGFYLVRRHPSLSDARINVGAGSFDSVQSSTGAFGPAVTPTLSAYRPETIQIQVINAPIGYNIGQGRYVTVPGARSGFDIVVGSDSFYVMQVVLTFEGEPLALAAGVLRNTSRLGSEKPAPEKSVFTNRAGRLVITDLAPGNYVVEFGQQNLRYAFSVAANKQPLIDLGTYRLEAK